jgi:hypothetical protein
MKSSWSINDFSLEDEPQPSNVAEDLLATRPLTRKEKEAIRFALIRNRPNRKGRGARRRAGEKKWATKGK